MPPPCSTWSAPGTSTPASPTRRRRSWRSGWRRWRTGVGAICTASGQAAMHLAIATLLGAGDHIVASASLYGGTINLLAHTLPRFGIATTFVKPRDLRRLPRRHAPQHPPRHRRDHRQSGPRSARHPAGRRHRPCRRRSAADRQHLRDPLSQPADRARRRPRDAFRHQMDRRPRHRDRRGDRRWRPLRLPGFGQVPHLTEPYAGYHGIVFAEEFGPAAFIMRARAEGLRDFGACLSPTNAFHLLQGVETLACACNATWRTPRRCSIS